MKIIYGTLLLLLPYALIIVLFPVFTGKAFSGLIEYLAGPSSAKRLSSDYERMEVEYWNEVSHDLDVAFWDGRMNGPVSDGSFFRERELMMRSPELIKKESGVSTRISTRSKQTKTPAVNKKVEPPKAQQKKKKKKLGDFFKKIFSKK